MKAYQTYITVTDANEVVIPNVPFAKGQEVQVMIVPRKRVSPEQLERLSALLRRTQELPQVRALSDDDIEAEIISFRNGE